MACHLIIKAVCRLGNLFYRDHILSLSTEQNNLISYFNIIYICDINHYLVHAYPSEYRSILSVDQYSSVIGKSSWISVSIACRNCCHLSRLICHICPAVAYSSSRFKSLYMNNPRLKCHCRLQNYRLIYLLRWIETIYYYTKPHHIKAFGVYLHRSCTVIYMTYFKVCTSAFHSFYKP